MKTWPYRSNDTRSTPISRFSTKIFIFGGKKKRKPNFSHSTLFTASKEIELKPRKFPFAKRKKVEERKSGRGESNRRSRRHSPFETIFRHPRKFTNFWRESERERERRQSQKLSTTAWCAHAAEQGCQIFLGTTYQNGGKIYQNNHKIYQITIT
jgi:hypothetical protein